MAKRPKKECPKCGEKTGNLYQHMRKHRNEKKEKTAKEKRMETIKKRKNKDQNKVINHLKEMPVIGVACSRAGISRSTYYRWRNEDDGFAEAAQKALNRGEAMVNDMAESQLIKMIQEGDRLGPLAFWLKNRHEKFASDVVVKNIYREKELEPIPEEDYKEIRQALKNIGLNPAPYNAEVEEGQDAEEDKDNDNENTDESDGDAEEDDESDE